MLARFLPLLLCCLLSAAARAQQEATLEKLEKLAGKIDKPVDLAKTYTNAYVIKANAMLAKEGDAGK